MPRRRPHTYRVALPYRRRYRRAAAALAGAAIVVVVLGAVGAVAPGVAGLPAAVLLAASFTYLAATRGTLEISAEGVRVHALGTHAFSPWADIDRIDRARVLGMRVEVLVLRRPYRGAGGRLAYLLRSGRRYPLSTYDPDWRSGRVAQDLAAHAPRLVATSPPVG